MSEKVLAGKSVHNTKRDITNRRYSVIAQVLRRAKMSGHMMPKERAYSGLRVSEMTKTVFAIVKHAKLLIVAMLMLFSCSYAFSGEYEIYRKEREWLINEISTILRNNNICHSRMDCNKKKIEHLYQPVDTGVYINIYVVTDKNTVMEIGQKAIELFTSRNDMSVTINFYNVPHDETMGLFRFSPKPFATINLTRRK
ncbi:MAG: hypothetical protein LBG78_06070 [Azoarcus sp.]|jgi:hypothetical protein|nr:hypothetical protein [Azoarcus sp.]